MSALAVIGSRTFADAALFEATLAGYSPDRIVSGGAKGADTLAKEYAQKRNIPLQEFRPDYGKYGRGAPLARNKLIVDAADEVLAFWDGKSRGTTYTTKYAESKGIPVRIVQFSAPPP